MAPTTIYKDDEGHRWLVLAMAVPATFVGYPCDTQQRREGWAEDVCIAITNGEQIDHLAVDELVDAGPWLEALTKRRQAWQHKGAEAEQRAQDLEDELKEARADLGEAGKACEQAEVLLAGLRDSGVMERLRDPLLKQRVQRFLSRPPGGAPAERRYCGACDGTGQVKEHARVEGYLELQQTGRMVECEHCHQSPMTLDEAMAALGIRSLDEVRDAGGAI